MDIIVKTYRFNLREAADRTEWAAFRAARAAEGLREFATRGGDMREASVRAYFAALDAINGNRVPLDTSHVFENQLNTGPIPGVSGSGLRVFDWRRDVWPNADIMAGHYIVQTEELRELRRTTFACGYCGKQERAPVADPFCRHCTDSPYLKAEDLYLTRLRPVCEERSRNSRPPLTPEESAVLLPRYREAQLHGSTARGKARLAKARADVERDYANATEQAAIKRQAATWILDNVPGVYENWLYYTHTGRHSFGWRSKLSADVASQLLDLISEFPFPYDIHCDDGRTLSGER